MITIKNTKTVPQKVMFQELGKEYAQAGGEQDTGLFPFEEVILQPGQELTLTEVQYNWVKVVDMTGTGEQESPYIG